MALDQYGDLAIAQIVFWVPGLLLAAYVTLKHGLRYHLDYAYIVALALAGLIGPSCTLANEQLTIPNTNLFKTAAICNGVSVSFMIQAILGLLIRVKEGTPTILPASPRTLKILHHLFTIVIFTGIVVGIIGAVKYIDGSSTGVALLKASYSIFAFCLVVVGICVVIGTTKLATVPQGEKRLIVCGLVCLPFVLTRLLYSMICILAQSAVFNYIQPSIWARAFMAVAQEFIVGTIIITTGLLSGSINHGDVESQPTKS